MTTKVYAYYNLFLKYDILSDKDVDNIFLLKINLSKCIGIFFLQEYSTRYLCVIVPPAR